MMMDQNDNVSVVNTPLRNEDLTGRPLRRIKLAGNALGWTESAAAKCWYRMAILCCG
jgi:hypothetical protein